MSAVLCTLGALSRSLCDRKHEDPAGLVIVDPLSRFILYVLVEGDDMIGDVGKLQEPVLDWNRATGWSFGSWSVNITDELHFMLQTKK